MNFHDITTEEFEGLNESRFEAAVVDAIVARHGDSATSMRYQLRRRAAQNGDDAWPTFFDFYEEFDFQLPMYLFARRWSKLDGEITLPVLVERFEMTRPWQEYETLADEVPHNWDGPVGLVFFCPHLKKGKTKDGGALVLHNGDSQVDRSGFVAKYGTDDCSLCLEPFNRLLNSWAASGFFGL